MNTENILPESAGTIVIGAGCVGCSAAYHLTKQSCEDVGVVDQKPLFGPDIERIRR